MRWNVRPKNTPREGEQRKVTEFALFPIVVEDKWVWLESYWSWQRYTVIFGWDETARYLK